MTSPERWVIQGAEALIAHQVPVSYLASLLLQESPRVSSGVTASRLQGALTVLTSASPTGTLHPSGGGDGWDGPGNKHE